MPLVPAKCTQCGSNLEIDSTKEAAICPFCNTPFITEKAINHYNTTNVTNIGNLHADVVNVTDDSSRDNRVKSGDTFIQLNDYYRAQTIFSELANECPYDYRGWWGLIKVKSENFTNYNISKVVFDEISGLYTRAYTVANEDEKEEISKQYKKYELETKKVMSLLKETTQNAIKRLGDEYKQNRTAIENRIESLNGEINSLSKSSNGVALASFSIAIIFSIGVGVSVGIGDFFVALILFGLIASGITSAVGGALDKEVDKKRKELSEKIRCAKENLKELEREYNLNMKPHNEKMSHVGDI